ncbi:MAG: N-6 DNA methylase, partial [Chloroflexi bacterium]|nr:N-6 DNA methylase [Chloroflexota bacterium]
EGSILPADLLQRIADGDSSLEGLRPEDYHLPKGEKLNEATNRSWNHLLGAWASFKAIAERHNGDPGTSETREKWLLPLFQELGYGRLQTARAIDVTGKSYPVSHTWGHVPIHLVSAGIDLDRRTACVAGAARSSPHSMVQELLNASEEHLWAFVSNGKQMRILRDNKSLTRQAYVEFDLQSMMDGEVYSDFVLLWLLCHESRVEGEQTSECWLEKWSKEAQEKGTRALDQLRSGVEAAINALGSGFLSHPANRPLREKLRAGDLSAQDYYRQLLRLVYRLIFLFAAEDRGLLLDPKAPVVARKRYMDYYSTIRLRNLAARRRGTRHADLFQGLRLVMEQLGSDTGCPALALPALDSFLFLNGGNGAMPDLEGCELANGDLLGAVRELAYTVDANTLRPVDYRNIGSEELGSVYESLLELHPNLNADAGTFSLKTVSGSERKTTGSYYTPTSLITSLLDSALDPVLDEAARKPNPEQAILDLKVCDPACGSGHFLIAAAHRIAKRLAAVRTGDEEPSPEATRKALRDVIGRCIFGVDLNPMAVELCKVSLWMEALEPGKPLSFLDHHIQHGNSLLGATPRLLKEGIPDEAFEPIEGDDKAVCSEYKKKNKQERTGQMRLLGFDMEEPFEQLGDIATAMLDIESYA